MKIKFGLVLITLIATIAGCNEDDIKRIYPRVSTQRITNITEAGAMFNGSIISSGVAETSTVGFVWGKNQNPTIENSEVVYLDLGEVVQGQFSFLARTTLEEDAKYWVRAFAQQNELNIYGDTSSFNSSGSFSNPIVTDFEPKSGTDSTEIVISGEGFSHKNEENLVTIGGLEASVLSSSVNEIKILVPVGIGVRESDLKVEVTGNEYIAEGKFVRNAPLLNSFSPENVLCNELITIIGENFGTTNQSNLVFFDEFQGTVVSSSASLLEVVAPIGLNGSYDLSIQTAAQTSVASEKVIIEYGDLCNESLVAYYPFNGNANDESSNSHNGTVLGATLAEDRNGNLNSAYYFDGVNDLIDIGNEVGNGISSVSLWFKTSSEIGNTNSRFISLMARNNSFSGSSNSSEFSIAFAPGNVFGYSNSAGKILVTVRDTDGKATASFSETNEWQSNKWYQLTIQINADSEVEIFVDGIENLDSFSVNQSSIIKTPDLDRITAIGAWGDLTSENRFFEGIIDDVRIYDRALNQSEIEYLSQN